MRIILALPLLLAACTTPGRILSTDEAVGTDATISVIARSRSQGIAPGAFCHATTGTDSFTFATPAELTVPLGPDNAPIIPRMSCTYNGLTLTADRPIEGRHTQVQFLFN